MGPSGLDSWPGAVSRRVAVGVSRRCHAGAPRSSGPVGDAAPGHPQRSHQGRAVRWCVFSRSAAARAHRPARSHVCRTAASSVSPAPATRRRDGDSGGADAQRALHRVFLGCRRPGQCRIDSDRSCGASVRPPAPRAHAPAGTDSLLPRDHRRRCRGAFGLHGIRRSAHDTAGPRPACRCHPFLHRAGASVGRAARGTWRRAVRPAHVLADRPYRASGRGESGGSVGGGSPVGRLAGAAVLRADVRCRVHVSRRLRYGIRRCVRPRLAPPHGHRPRRRRWSRRRTGAVLFVRRRTHAGRLAVW